MLRLRIILATLVAKSARELVRRLGVGGGSALPGLLALRICPRYVEVLSGRLREGAVVITGTNGKTTTASLLAEMARQDGLPAPELRQAGRRVVHNATGSNLLRGVATALADQATLSGQLRAELGIFEVDEATMPEAVGALKPKAVLVTNLFRDQLDRYGELDKTAAVISGSLKGSGAAVLLNADDPLVASLGRDLPGARYFGLRDQSFKATEFERATDSRECPLCGTELVFSANYFGHLGEWRCPAGDLAAPERDFQAERIRLEGLEGTRLRLRLPAILDIHLRLPGLYSAYNALQAAALATLISIPPEIIGRVLESDIGVFGRIERVSVSGREAALILVKNPAGLNQALSLLRMEKGRKRLLMALNDNFADGTDVSWIWDSDLEKLAGETARVTASGIRASDLTLRLKYAGIDPSQITQVDSLPEALESAVAETPRGETLYVLPTYTAMLELRRILARQGHVRHFWEPVGKKV